MLNFIYRMGWLCCGLLLLPGLALARHAAGMGEVAGNLIEPVNLLSNFVGTAAIVIGISCLFAAFLKYMQYRINPLAAPIGTVILLVILGVILTLLPFAYNLTESGIPYGYDQAKPPVHSP